MSSTRVIPEFRTGREWVGKDSSRANVRASRQRPSEVVSPRTACMNLVRSAFAARGANVLQENR